MATPPPASWQVPSCRPGCTVPHPRNSKPAVQNHPLILYSHLRDMTWQLERCHPAPVHVQSMSDGASSDDAHVSPCAGNDTQHPLTCSRCRAVPAHVQCDCELTCSHCHTAPAQIQPLPRFRRLNNDMSWFLSLSTLLTLEVQNLVYSHPFPGL